VIAAPTGASFSQWQLVRCSRIRTPEGCSYRGFQFTIGAGFAGVWLTETGFVMFFVRVGMNGLQFGRTYLIADVDLVPGFTPAVFLGREPEG
jgi:hypothetical protein